MAGEMFGQDQLADHLDDLATAFVRLLAEIDEKSSINVGDLSSIVMPALRGSAALVEAGLLREQTLEAMWQSATGANPNDGGEAREHAPGLRLVYVASRAFSE